MTKKDDFLFKIAIPEIDLGNKSMWEEFNDDERTKAEKSFWVLNRYISNAETSNRQHTEHFVLTVNEYFNKHWFTLQKHPKLMWQLLSMCSWDGKKTFFHKWIGLGKDNNNKRYKLLQSAYPDMKDDEIELLLEISTDDELKELARELSWTDKEIKDL